MWPDRIYYTRVRYYARITCTGKIGNGAAEINCALIRNSKWIDRYRGTPGFSVYIGMSMIYETTAHYLYATNFYALTEFIIQILQENLADVRAVIYAACETAAWVPLNHDSMNY